MKKKNNNNKKNQQKLKTTNRSETHKPIDQTTYEPLDRPPTTNLPSTRSNHPLPKPPKREERGEERLG